MSIEFLVAQLLALGGVGALIPVLVNFGKAFGWIQDGTAPQWFVGLQLLALNLLFVAKLAGVVDVAGIDAGLAQLAQLLALVLAIILQIGVGKITYWLVRGRELFKLPIGFSHTLNG